MHQDYSSRRDWSAHGMVLLCFRLCCLISIAGIVLQRSVVFDDSQHELDDLLVGPRYSSRNSRSRSHSRSNSRSSSSRNNANHHQNANTTQPSRFAPVPEASRKLVWFGGAAGHKLYLPVYRAFHARGYSATKDLARARFVWTDQPWTERKRDFFATLEPWQRYNYLPHTRAWDDKDKMALRMNEYYQREGTTTGKHPKGALHSFPESYVVHDPAGLEAFEQRLFDGGGLDLPWVLKKPTVNQGKGITVLPPRSPELTNISGTVRAMLGEDDGEDGDSFDEAFYSNDDHKKKRLVVQQYISDELTLMEGRKFDVRVFWAVLSVDPLVVAYHTQHNYVRIGHAKYDESSLRSNASASEATRQHLTTHTFRSSETKATWDEFREAIEEHALRSEFTHRFANKPGQTKELQTTLETIRKDPFGHVQKQIMTVVAHLVDAYKNITFHARDMTMDNGYGWHALDMILDNNLDVYAIEGTDGPGKDEDYDFRTTMHDALFGDLVDAIAYVGKVQEDGRPIDVGYMKQEGILGGYEIVYNDNWFLDYRYERLPRVGCLAGGAKPPPTTYGITIDTPRTTDDPRPIRPIRSATFTALPRPNGTLAPPPTLTFWMKSRTSRRAAPVARAFRRNGWWPVDTVDRAQVVYFTDEEFGHYNRHDYHDKFPDPGPKPRLQPWQWLGQFRSQYSFFEGPHLHYLGLTTEYDDDAATKTLRGGVCRPILTRVDPAPPNPHEPIERPLEIVVYWLVLSVDPAIVLYHDGFSYHRFAEDNEFVTLSSSSRHGRGPAERVWKGSWKTVEDGISRAYGDLAERLLSVPSVSPAAFAVAALSIPPLEHVRNQMKAALVRLAEGFVAHTLELDYLETHRSFALFQAKFQVDTNLNVFLKETSHSGVKAEDFGEIVDLHNDLYGSALRLLDHLNNTVASRSKILRPKETRGSRNLRGNYEWLLRPILDEKTRNTTQWKFRYDWEPTAHECFD